ncbi:MAG: hypothetical protein C0402_11430 [Thermodesulfovibrio sp.]|nr:hypothetical protein [Thermodesulfovibrio sp.]
MRLVLNLIRNKPSFRTGTRFSTGFRYYKSISDGSGHPDLPGKDQQLSGIDDSVSSDSGARTELTGSQAAAAETAAALRSIDLFSSLSEKLLSRLAYDSRRLTYKAGTRILSHTDKNEDYYVIISGSVRVYQVTDTGEEVSFATLGPGEGFGEIALLTQAPRSASVAAVSDSDLLLIPRDALIRVIFSNAEASMQFARVLAERLTRGNIHLIEVANTEHSYRQFISEHLRPQEPQLPGESLQVLKLHEEISALSECSDRVLVQGEPGTEVWDAASLIHQSGPVRQGILLGLDVRTLSVPPHAALDPEIIPYMLDMVQNSLLYGRKMNALSFAPDSRPGLLQMAAAGTLIIEHLEHLTPDVQKKLFKCITEGSFSPVGETKPMAMNARIISTTNADLQAMVDAGTFDRGLFELLAQKTITVPPLRKRKKDIRAILDRLILQTQSQTDKAVRGISGEAYKALMAYGWPGNRDELNTVLRRAISISRGEELQIEDLFIGPPPVTGRVAFNLLKLDFVRKVFSNATLRRALQFCIGGFIAAIIISGIAGSQQAESNSTIVLTWGLWEPALVISAFFAARLWCSACPIGAASSFLGRTIGLRRKVPQFLREYGIYFSAAGLALIFWSESASGMISSPRATSLLILSVVLGALIVGLLYRRRAWCRFLCPLGGMVGLLSSCSVIEMRSNYNICNNDCKTHACYAGEGAYEGCPMYEGPFSLSSNLNCILCGKCIGACPNKSPVLNLRLPAHELWTARSPEKGLVALGLTLIATQLFRGLEMAGVFGLHATGPGNWWKVSIPIFLGLMALTYLAFRYLGRLVFPADSIEKGRSLGLFIYGLIPLAVAFEMAFHTGRLLTMGGSLLNVLGRQMDWSYESPALTVPGAVVKVFQILFILLGSFASLGVFSKLLRSERPCDSPRPSGIRQAWPLLILTFGYLLFFMRAAG